ncbi:MAG: metallophosphoesterase [Chloroflexota bacterium]
MGKKLKLYYAGDIHGSEKCFLKFVNAAKFYKADVLILGGDITGKGIVTLVERPGGGFGARFMGRDYEFQSDGEVLDLEKNIRFNGMYPYRCTQDELERMRADVAYMDTVWENVTKASVARWEELAAERLDGTGIRALAMAGNDDEWYIDDVLKTGSGMEYVDRQVIELGEYQVLSLSWANPTPWGSPREFSEADMAIELHRLAQDLDRGRHWIFNLHVPPYNSSLDMAAELTEDLAVVRKGGEPQIIPVGSTAVRSFIEEYQPVVSLHGHIHESRGVAKIGNTVCINPGSMYAEGVIHGALVTVEGAKVKQQQLVSG